MREDNARKAKLIEALIKKNKALMQSLLAEKKPARIVILSQGDPVPPAIPGDPVLYVEEVPTLGCKQIATSEDMVDLKPMTPCQGKPCYQSCIAQFPDEENTFWMRYRMGLIRKAPGREQIDPQMN